MDKYRIPMCKCERTIGLYFSNRLNRYICPICLETEIISLKKELEESKGLLTDDSHG